MVEAPSYALGVHFVPPSSGIFQNIENKFPDSTAYGIGSSCPCAGLAYTLASGKEDMAPWKKSIDSM